MPHPIRSDHVETLATQIADIVPVSYLRQPALLDDLAARWCERHRVWHGPKHLLSMLTGLAGHPPGPSRDALLLAALYHDAIYNPRAGDNEEASAALLMQHAADPSSDVIRQAAEMITASKWAEPPANALVDTFFAHDARQLADDCPLSERADYERAIFREYQWADWPTYLQKRQAFLEGWARQFPQQRRGTAECVALLEALHPRIAVYPGSFHPFHHGHLSILRQAESIFDKVIVAVGVNRQKPGATESAAARHQDLQNQLRFHEVVLFDGLLSRFVENLPLPVTVVRGVRDGTDLEAELRYTRFLNELRPQTGVVWISCGPELQHLSSSAIRELESIEPGAGQRYVPDAAAIYDLVPV